MSKFGIKGLVVCLIFFLIFLCSLIQTLTLTSTPNNALVAGKHGHVRVEGDLTTSYFLSIRSPFALLVCLSAAKLIGWSDIESSTQ